MFWVFFFIIIYRGIRAIVWRLEDVTLICFSCFDVVCSQKEVG